MALVRFFVARRAERDAVEKRHILAHLRRLAYHDPRAVVDEEARAYLCRRVDFNPRPPAHEKRQKPRQHRYMQRRMQKMNPAVRRYGEKARRTEEDLEKSARAVRNRRVVALSREIVASDSPPCVHVITSCNKKEGPLSQAP